VLRDPGVFDANRCVLDATQAEQFGHLEGLLEVAVDEDGDHVRIGSVGGQQTSQHSVQVVRPVARYYRHRHIIHLQMLVFNKKGFFNSQSSMHKFVK